MSERNETSGLGSAVAGAFVPGSLTVDVMRDVKKDEEGREPVEGLWDRIDDKVGKVVFYSMMALTDLAYSFVGYFSGICAATGLDALGMEDGRGVYAATAATVFGLRALFGYGIEANSENSD